MCLLSCQAKKPITQVRVIGWLLPAIESAVTSCNVTLLQTDNMLHPGICTASNKAGCENNSEDEEQVPDSSNGEADHECVLSNGGVSIYSSFLSRITSMLESEES